jgi:hypothetical protein
MCRDVCPDKYWFALLCRSCHQCCRMRRSAAAALVGLWVRIPPGSGILSLMSIVVCADRSLWRTDPSIRGVLPSVVCAIRRNNNHPQLQWVGRRGLTEIYVFDCDFLVVSQLGDHVTISSRLKFRRMIHFAALYLTDHFCVKTQFTLVSQVTCLLYQMTGTKRSRKEMQKAVAGHVLWYWISIVTEKALCLGQQLKLD